MQVELSVTVIDVRQYDFDTLPELEQLVHDANDHLAECHPGEKLGVVIISEYQQKLLNLERYEEGVPLPIIHKEFLGMVDGVPDVTARFDEGCPNCGSMVHWQ